MSRTFSIERHVPKPLFHGRDDLDEDANEGQGAAAKQAASWKTAAVVFRTTVPDEAVGTCSEGSTVTTVDVARVLRERGVVVACVEWLRMVSPNQVAFVSRNAGGYEVVRGLVVLKAKVENGTIIAYADIEVIDDGESTF